MNTFSKSRSSVYNRLLNHSFTLSELILFYNLILLYDEKGTRNNTKRKKKYNLTIVRKHLMFSLTAVCAHRLSVLSMMLTTSWIYCVAKRTIGSSSVISSMMNSLRYFSILNWREYTYIDSLKMHLKQDIIYTNHLSTWSIKISYRTKRTYLGIKKQQHRLQNRVGNRKKSKTNHNRQKVLRTLFGRKV